MVHHYVHIMTYLYVYSLFLMHSLTASDIKS